MCAVVASPLAMLVSQSIRTRLCDVNNITELILNYTYSPTHHMYLHLLCWTHRPAQSQLLALLPQFDTRYPYESLKEEVLLKMYNDGFTLHPSITMKRYKTFRDQLNEKLYYHSSLAFFSSFYLTPFMSHPVRAAYVFDLQTYLVDDTKLHGCDEKEIRAIEQAEKRERRQKHKQQREEQRVRNRTLRFK